jgi:leucyl-tRNA synthetase
VLANEQVIDGRGWRTGALVEKREIPGYYLKITDYAEELLSAVTNEADPNYLKGWPDRVRAMQENWIGKSVGVRFAFTHDIRGADGELVQGGRMYVFTTRADTIMGVTFCAVAPEHPLAVRAAQLNPALAPRIEALKAGGTTEAELATKDKEGVDSGLSVTHPLTGEAVPLWVGNYVLMSYGDGAVMGVPAHDERDFAFAKKYGLAIKPVVDVDGKPYSTDAWQEWYAEKGPGIAVNSGTYNSLAFQACVDAVASDLATKGLGEKKTTFRLRDWGISRQRYWGTPIPIIHCDEHGAVPVPLKDLPVVLPEDCIPDGSGNPLHKHEGFHKGVVCPVCGKPARRETDTMDTFVDSSWYFVRYCLPQADQQASATMVSAGVDYWMPKAGTHPGNAAAMDQYIGGIEHAVLHLLYARFWTKVMRDMGLVQFDEPFTRLLCQGMVLNHVYSRKTAQGGMEYFWPHEVEHTFGADGKITGAKLKADGSAVDYGGVTTMSKSKNNGVDPEDIITKYGADTARLYMMFTAPPEATLEWNDAAVEGSYRFLRRVWSLAQKHHEAFSAHFWQVTPSASLDDCSPEAKQMRLEVYATLKQVNYDYERLQYNTVVSGCMKMANAIEGFDPLVAKLRTSTDQPAPTRSSEVKAFQECFGILLRVLYPVCPHITSQLWADLGYDRTHGPLLDAPWPQVDPAALEQDEIELVLQVNGKTRGAVRVPKAADKAAIEAAAVASEAFTKFAAGAMPKKVVVVPGRLVNLVV